MRQEHKVQRVHKEILVPPARQAHKAQRVQWEQPERQAQLVPQERQVRQVHKDQRAHKEIQEQLVQ